VVNEKIADHLGYFLAFMNDAARKEAGADLALAELVRSQESTVGRRSGYNLSLVTERISPGLMEMMPSAVFKEKFPESSFAVMFPSVGFGKRPVSGRRVTLTRSPTANTFKVFANDSKIAITAS
jgi:hypothetical protein